jgi:hypothetical protein
LFLERDAACRLMINRAKGLTDAQIDSNLHALQVAVNAIFALWSNSYRYASEERLLAHLKHATGYKKTKGDYLKARAREFLNSTQTFINKGVIQWPFSGK